MESSTYKKLRDTWYKKAKVLKGEVEVLDDINILEETHENRLEYKEKIGRNFARDFRAILNSNEKIEFKLYEKNALNVWDTQQIAELKSVDDSAKEESCTRWYFEKVWFGRKLYPSEESKLLKGKSIHLINSEGFIFEISTEDRDLLNKITIYNCGINTRSPKQHYRLNERKIFIKNREELHRKFLNHNESSQKVRYEIRSENVSDFFSKVQDLVIPNLINEAEKLIFDLFVRGHDKSTISAFLNKKGIKSWSRSTVSRKIDGILRRFNIQPWVFNSKQSLK